MLPRWLDGGGAAGGLRPVGAVVVVGGAPLLRLVGAIVGREGVAPLLRQVAEESHPGARPNILGRVRPPPSPHDGASPPGPPVLSPAPADATGPKHSKEGLKVNASYCISSENATCFSSAPPPASPVPSNTSIETVGAVLTALSTDAVSLRDAPRIVRKEACAGLAAGLLLGAALGPAVHYLGTPPPSRLVRRTARR